MVLVKCFIVFFVLINGTDAVSSESQLIKDLLKDYTALARPVLDDTHSVNVTFGLTLNKIIGVNEKDQNIVINVWTWQTWYNRLLTWDPKKYNGIQSVSIQPQYVWKPDILLYTNEEFNKAFGGNLDRMNTRVMLYADGRNRWIMPMIIMSGCPIKVKYFPFDTQNCKLKFGSWTYDKLRVNMSMENDTADLDTYANNAEWRLNSAKAQLNEKKYITGPNIYQDVTYTISISRRSEFYVVNLIFPIAILGFLSVISFSLPGESGERIGLAITLLLALTVFLLTVNGIIPSTSDAIPLVTIYFFATLIQIVLMIVCLIAITRLYHKTDTCHPMPQWVRRFFLDWLSYKLNIQVQKHKKNDVIPEKQDGSNQITGSDNIAMKKQDSTEKVTDVTSNEFILSRLEAVLAKLTNNDDVDIIKAEWVIVARTIDFCLLVFFAMVYVVTLVAWIAVTPGYVE